MFGLSEIIVVVAIGWVVSRLFRRMNPGRQRTLDQPAPPPPLNSGQPIHRSVTEEIGGREQWSTPSVTPVVRTRDEQIAELRRRYVADEITVEEYEAELDKLMKT
jgi:uncharacterized Ntn-hydrolase superfamily protein